jgi:hypothetical protein
MSAAMCGVQNPGCRFAHPGYARYLTIPANIVASFLHPSAFR